MSSDSQSTVSLSSASSQEPQVADLQRRIRELEQRNAVLQQQFDMQWAPSQTSPPGFRAVPITSRPFSTPFLWPIRPAYATAGDMQYMENLTTWAARLSMHLRDERDAMKGQMQAWASFKRRWLEQTGEELPDPALERERQGNGNDSANANANGSGSFSFGGFGTANNSSAAAAEASRPSGAFSFGRPRA